ncbi:UNVERIFIED_CONTAM: hypothetical protein K2H54_052967 [Gekko kuhli]
MPYSLDHDELDVRVKMMQMPYRWLNLVPETEDDQQEVKEKVQTAFTTAYKKFSVGGSTVEEETTDISNRTALAWTREVSNGPWKHRGYKA